MNQLRQQCALVKWDYTLDFYVSRSSLRSNDSNQCSSTDSLDLSNKRQSGKIFVQICWLGFVDVRLGQGSKAPGSWATCLQYRIPAVSSRLTQKTMTILAICHIRYCLPTPGWPIAYMKLTSYLHASTMKHHTCSIADWSITRMTNSDPTAPMRKLQIHYKVLSRRTHLSPRSAWKHKIQQMLHRVRWGEAKQSRCKVIDKIPLPYISKRLMRYSGTQNFRALFKNRSWHGKKTPASKIPSTSWEPWPNDGTCPPCTRTSSLSNEPDDCNHVHKRGFTWSTIGSRMHW